MEQTGHSLTPEHLLHPTVSPSHCHHAITPCPTCLARALPEEEVMGVAMRPLALMAAMCCICTAAMVAIGLR